VPAAPQDGQAPNLCSALAPQSEQTYADFARATAAASAQISTTGTRGASAQSS
jgi:hypothetical protein